MKFTKEQIIEILAEKEAEALREQEKSKLEKSLKVLLRKAEKQGFVLHKKLASHMEKNEADRYELFWNK